MLDIVWLIPLFPLTGALVNGLVGSKLDKKTVSLIGCTAVCLSLFVSIILFFNLISRSPENRW